MKRLLAISWEMPPMYGPRGTQVSRLLGALPPLGWQPTVVCLAPRPGGPHWSADAAATPRGVELVRVPSSAESLLVRTAWRLAPALRDYPDTARVWVRRATLAAARLAASRAAAAMITFAQPWSDHLIGLRLHRQLRLPWVAHFSDPWADSPYASAHQRAIWRPMEEAVVDAASALVFVTEETAELVMRKYPKPYRDKVTIVPHGYEPFAAAPTSAVAHPSSRPLRMLHAGRFYRGMRTPSAMLKALAAINQRGSLTGRLEATFLGPHGAEFSDEARSLGLNGVVKFLDRAPAREVERAALDTDVLLVIDAPSDGPSVFLPSKLIDYLRYRKPIIGLTPEPGASARLLRRLGFPVAPPNDAAAIARLIDDVLGHWVAGSLQVGESFDRIAAAYDIRCTARALHDVLARIVA